MTRNQPLPPDAPKALTADEVARLLAALHMLNEALIAGEATLAKITAALAPINLSTPLRARKPRTTR